MASSLVNNKYRITRRIGGGSFGEIYMGVGPNNEKVVPTEYISGSWNLADDDMILYVCRLL
jgi:hypothetical protein